MVERGSRRLFACYLLVSLSQAKRGRTYVGFTVDPERRLRQHNGEITNGAKRTSKLRPVEMVLVVHGFPSKVQALQFEWAWQNPLTSRAAREMAIRLGFSDKTFSVPNKVRMLFEMLCLPAWSRHPLGVRFLSEKYAHHQNPCPRLPEHMTVEVGSAAGLWQSYARMESGDTDEEDEEDQGYFNSGVDSEMERSASGASASTACGAGHGDVCSACDGQLGSQRRVVICPCSARAHAHCLAVRFLRAEDAHPCQLIPTAGQCPVCNVHTTWAELVAHTARVNRRPLRQLTTNRGTGNAGRSRVGKRAAGYSHDDPRSSRGRHGEPTAVAPSVLHGLNEQAEVMSATPPPPAPHATSWERRGAATVERERGRIARWATALLDSPDNSPLPVAATLHQLPSSQQSPALVAEAGADCCSISSSHVDDSCGEENETETGVVAASVRPPRRDMSPRMARLETNGFTPRRRPPSLALVGSSHARAHELSPDTDDADDTAPLLQRLARRRRSASTQQPTIVIVDSSGTE